MKSIFGTNGLADRIAHDFWVDLEMPKCPQFVLDRVGKNTIRHRMVKKVELNLSYCTDDGFARRNFNSCKVEGSVIADYRYRCLSTPLGEMITSIRFVGGDLSKPAVFLIHKEFELELFPDILLIGQIVLKEYAVFNPQRIRWYSSKIETDLIESGDFISGDLVYVAEFIDHLKQQPLPLNFEKIQLNIATSLDWYEDYKTAYERIQSNWPPFEEMGQLESQATLQNLMGRKLLFEIYIEGEWAGIIAVNTGSDYFLKGYYIVEELLLENFRGRRFAAAVQRHLIDRLPSNPNDMLFGTIHYDNLPSLRTGFRVGRKPIGMYVFAEIQGCNE